MILRMKRAVKCGLSVLALVGMVGCADYVLVKKDQLEEIIDTRLKQQDAELRRELAQDQFQERELIRQEIMRELMSEFAPLEEENGQDGARDSEEYDIRSVCWGMALEEVVCAEGTNYLTCSKEGVTYLTKAVDIPCLLHYGFIDSQLTEAVFLFADPRYADMLPAEARNQQKVLNDYLRLKQMLENKYGHCKVQEKQYSRESELRQQSDQLRDKITGYDRHRRDLDLKIKRERDDLRKRYADWDKKKRDSIVEAKVKPYQKEIRRAEDWIRKLKRQKEDVDQLIVREKKLAVSGEVPSSVRCCWKSGDSHEVVLYYSNARQSPALRLAYNGMAVPELSHLPTDL